MDVYEQFITRLKALGCKFCRECVAYVWVPHPLHPNGITNRKSEIPRKLKPPKKRRSR